MTIETTHLQLLPYSAHDLLALLDGVAQFEARTGFKAADGYGDFIKSDDVSPEWLAQLRSSASENANPWIYGFGIAHLESGLVIGTVGFKGPPDEDGMVEIAYGIVPTFQGKGYATEAAEAAIAFAFNTSNVRVVRAHTLPTNTPSKRVLEKCRFEYIGETVDPEDGLVLRWERNA